MKSYGANIQLYLQEVLYNQKKMLGINKDITILGHSIGVIMIRSEVFNECMFEYKNIFDIGGQDIGFFISAFIN